MRSEMCNVDHGAKKKTKIGTNAEQFHSSIPVHTKWKLSFLSKLYRFHGLITDERKVKSILRWVPENKNTERDFSNVQKKTWSALSRLPRISEESISTPENFSLRFWLKMSKIKSRDDAAESLYKPYHLHGLITDEGLVKVLFFDESLKNKNSKTQLHKCWISSFRHEVACLHFWNGKWNEVNSSIFTQAALFAFVERWVTHGLFT